MASFLVAEGILSEADLAKLKAEVDAEIGFARRVAHHVEPDHRFNDVTEAMRALDDHQRPALHRNVAERHPYDGDELHLVPLYQPGG